MYAKIIFNGKAYTKVEEMPTEARQAYEQALAQFADANKNGIPDILEGGAAGNVISIQQSSISFNGREYKSEGEMPAVVRRLFEMAMGQADLNRNNIPDALETALGMKPATAAAETPQSAQPIVSARPHASEINALERTANTRRLCSGCFWSRSVLRRCRRNFSHAPDESRLAQPGRPVLCRAGRPGNLGRHRFRDRQTGRPARPAELGEPQR